MENDSQSAGASLKDLLAQRKALDAKIESLTRVRFAGPPERVSAIDKVARVMVQFKLTVQELEDAVEMITVGLRISDQDGALSAENRPQRKKPGPKPGFKRKPKPTSSSEASAPAVGGTTPETSRTTASQSPFSLSSQNDSGMSVG